MNKPLRVGVIGCGGIAQMMHLPFLAERPDLFAIESLADTDARTVELVGRRYRVERQHTDYRRLLDDPLEAVLILSGGSHAQPVVDAAVAGKHILVEKPLGENLAEVDQVAAALARAKVTLMVGYHKRYDPGYRYAREQVRRLKDLRTVRVDVLHPVDARARDHYVLEPSPDPARAALADSEATDGLVEYAVKGPPRQRIDAIVGPEAPLPQQVATFLLFNSLIHDVNALRGILGEPEEVVFSEFWRGGRCMHTLVRWNEGLRAALTWTYLPGLPHYKEELLFASPEGRVTISFPSPYYRHLPTPITVESVEDGALAERTVTVSYEEAFRAELHHFHHCVTTGARPETGLDDARGDTLLLEKIARAYRAAR
ncbi:MAG: Gfo/Idh/MocA family oxidoreductase [Deltaproteobacteria bacterium]|nr:Gfo/Idh/MocA family oxidoreductase [Deltaproteobacteria bacterium]